MIYFSAFFICVLLLSVLVLCSLLSFIFVCFLVLFFARTRRESIKIISAVLLFVLLLTFFWQGIWTWGSGYPPSCPYSTVRKSMPGVRSDGRVGGQATQPGSTRTPSPSVQPGGITPPGSGATMASRHSGTVLGLRHPTDTMW